VHTAEVRVNYAALQVSLVKAGLLEASEALYEWAQEWLDYSEEETEQLNELLDIPED
jgi:hypothetical protein